MDPLSIISGCAGLITAIGSLSVSINAFVRSCREARSDLDRVSRELHSLQTVLELIEEDAKDVTKPFPPTIQHHVSGIVTNCGSVVLEVETCIKKYGDGRIKTRAAWAINGQGDMEKLRSSLEAHKSALELALDMLSLSLTKDIKADTTEIREDTAAIKDDTALILQEIAKLQARLPETAAAPNDYILQKFLEDMATYTETTLNVDLFHSDGMSSRALSTVDEHDDSSTKSPQYNLPIIGSQDPAMLVASQSPHSSNPRSGFRNGIHHPAAPESYDHGRNHWPRSTREDIPHRPKGPGPASSYNKYSYEKEVVLGSDPQASGPSQQVEIFNHAPSQPHQPQQMPYRILSAPQTQSNEEDIMISPSGTQELSSIEKCNVQRLRGQIVLDIPVPAKILNLVPHSPLPHQDEFTHTRFSLITSSPNPWAAQKYAFRPDLFTPPRQIEFILVMQLNPNDKDFISRWNLIHDSIIYAQQQRGASRTSSQFWKKVVVHLHLGYGTQWGHRTVDHPLNVLECIGAKQRTITNVLNIASKYLDEPVDEESSTIGGRKIHAVISEYTVQLRPASFPFRTVPAETPIQVLVTSAHIQETALRIKWSDKYIPWTYTISKAFQAEHVINMSKISEASLSHTHFLFKLERLGPFSSMKYKQLQGWDLRIVKFDSLVAENRLRAETVSKTKSSRVGKWLKSRRG